MQRRLFFYVLVQLVGMRYNGFGTLLSSYLLVSLYELVLYLLEIRSTVLGALLSDGQCLIRKL